MGACLSCGSSVPVPDSDFPPALKPAADDALLVSADASSARWPSTEVGSLHPHATFSDGQLATPAAPTTCTESSVEVLTPSPTCTKTPGEYPTGFSERAELVRTPTGPPEESPSSGSETGWSEEGAARNKCVSALFDKAAGREEGADGGGDFDIPAVRTTRRRQGPELADLPLSKFKARSGA